MCAVRVMMILGISMQATKTSFKNIQNASSKMYQNSRLPAKRLCQRLFLDKIMITFIVLHHY